MLCGDGNRVFSVEGTGCWDSSVRVDEEYSIRPLVGIARDRAHRRVEPAADPPPEARPLREARIPCRLRCWNRKHWPPVISVAVAYTPAAANGIRIRYGVEPDRLAAHAVDLTNRSFAFSGVNARIALVGVRQIATPESGDFARDVAAMVDPADGRFDELPPWRRSLRANAVITLVGTSGACGRAAQVYAPAQAAYAAVNYACAIENKSFAHELGHLLGLRHDRTRSQGP